MTQEEKQLLLKDLCARLPYGTKFPYHMNGDSNHKECDSIATIDGISDDIVEFTYEENGVTRDWSCPISEVKPYLRPMSSMTEEEEMEVKKFGVCYDKAFHNDIYDTGISMEEAFTAISWFLERHFDINYLIEKGLAMEAPEGMYKI